jgi:hypothetical protein
LTPALVYAVGATTFLSGAAYLRRLLAGRARGDELGASNGGEGES